MCISIIWIIILERRSINTKDIFKQIETCKLMLLSELKNSCLNPDCFGFVLSCFKIGLENSPHPLNQKYSKLRPTEPWSLTFSELQAYSFLVFTFNSYFLLVKVFFVLIGHFNYFGLVLQHSIKCNKRSLVLID